MNLEKNLEKCGPKIYCAIFPLQNLHVLLKNLGDLLKHNFSESFENFESY